MRVLCVDIHVLVMLFYLVVMLLAICTFDHCRNGHCLFNIARTWLELYNYTKLLILVKLIRHVIQQYVYNLNLLG